ncbi:MAG TPA: hypothetical protein VLR69_17950, partial [Thermoanaerobaculia bacterium]|nr:hypothetical protein [Thermoanaerobaculia bacterium]
MRKINPHSLLPALLVGAALLAFGCNRGEESHAGQVEKPVPATQITQTQAPAPAPVPRPQINELQTPPRAVRVAPQTPPPSVEKSDLDARERALAAREADLDTRERRLQQPKPQRPVAARSAPRPSPPVAQTAPAPAPAPEPAASEPAPSFDP